MLAFLCITMAVSAHGLTGESRSNTVAQHTLHINLEAYVVCRLELETSSRAAMERDMAQLLERMHSWRARLCTAC